MYAGELFLLFAFPCDIQIFRLPDGKMVSINTRVHVGNIYFNPNYACLEEYSQLGIYIWSHWHILHEAIRLRCNVVNFMASMRAAKKAIGCRSLGLASMVGACCSPTNTPQEKSMEESSLGDDSKKPAAREACTGGKRAARKKAAAAAAGGTPAEAAQGTEQAPPKTPTDKKKAAKKKTAQSAEADDCAGTNEVSRKQQPPSPVPATAG